MTEAPEICPETLLASLREMPGPGDLDPALKQRLQSRLAVYLVGLDPAVTTGSAATLGGDASAQVSAMAPASNAVVVATKSAILAWLAPVFVLGALSGVAADRWYTVRHTAVAVETRHVELPPAVVQTATPVVREAVVEDLEPVREVAVTVPLTNLPLASAEPSNGMAAERQLLDAARTALARGEPAGGVASLEKHVKRFPKGLLAEEREALYVRILVAMGNDVAASARAANFQRRYPNSIFLPVVERAVASISRRNASSESKL